MLHGIPELFYCLDGFSSATGRRPGFSLLLGRAAVRAHQARKFLVLPAAFCLHFLHELQHADFHHVVD